VPSSRPDLFVKKLMGTTSVVIGLESLTSTGWTSLSLPTFGTTVDVSDEGQLILLWLEGYSLSLLLEVLPASEAPLMDPVGPGLWIWCAVIDRKVNVTFESTGKGLPIHRSKYPSPTNLV
jgi:hypothetical protein